MLGLSLTEKTKVNGQRDFFLALGASEFDAATDLAYKGYRIRLRGCFINAISGVFQAAVLLAARSRSVTYFSKFLKELLLWLGCNLNSIGYIRRR